MIDNRCLIHIPDNLLDIYGDDPDVPTMGAASYMGMPLLDLDGAIVGHLVRDALQLTARQRKKGSCKDWQLLFVTTLTTSF